MWKGILFHYTCILLKVQEYESERVYKSIIKRLHWFSNIDLLDSTVKFVQGSFYMYKLSFWREFEKRLELEITQIK